MGFNFLEEENSIWFTKASASNTPHIAQQIFEAGADGVRIALSFGDKDLHIQLAEMFRRSGDFAGKDVDIIADLAGEQVRIADLGHYKKLEIPEGDKVSLVPPNNKFNEENLKIPIDSEEMIKSVEKGEKLYIGDGDVILRVKKAGKSLQCSVESSGTINPRRGVQPQSKNFEPEALTEQDREYLKFLAETGKFDAVAISFVSKASEVREAMKIMEKAGDKIPIISKIETGKGVENAAEIAEISDAIMVARGDLALLEPWKELGLNCEKIVEAAEEKNTPWIMATQLLEGLEHFSIPLRPEISDIQRWRDRDADGFMLCHETAFGENPLEATQRLRALLE